MALALVVAIPSLAQEEPDIRLPITLYTADQRLTRVAERLKAASEALRLNVVQIMADQTDDLSLAAGRVDLVDLTFAYYDVVEFGFAANLDPWIQRTPALRPWQAYLDSVREAWGQFVVPLGRQPVLLVAYRPFIEKAGLVIPQAGLARLCRVHRPTHRP